jgi:hypothetical protein
MLLNSYAAKLWTQPYFGLNMSKYKVTFEIVLKNMLFLFATWVKENKMYVKDRSIIINI